MYLNCHTYYSLRYGTFPIRELCELAYSNDIWQFAITDINNTSACLEFLRLTNGTKIKPVLGIDFRNAAEQQYIGLAKKNGLSMFVEFGLANIDGSVMLLKMD